MLDLLCLFFDSLGVIQPEAFQSLRINLIIIIIILNGFYQETTFANNLLFHRNKKVIGSIMACKYLGTLEHPMTAFIPPTPRS